ncbi:CAP domain-containing protein [Nostoc sp. ChiVER01]|uniref:CAP domain-containing protein n=1 Tax=Nostoc sp. ChiVER01 TaxID=3075382 RepID=UPI002AD2FB89|nr:CAP domain-containing protein [Nostoc sp. ChiVER01]MDZ8224337.1 CAP domain-containing protein [Nostoc sp. ChiVER01]
MIKTTIYSVALGTILFSSGAIATPVTNSTFKPTYANVSNSTFIIAASSVNTAALEEAVFKQINDYRVSQGLKKLTRNSAIDNQARIHSQDMAQGKVPFGHTGFSERVKAVGIPYSSAGENVASNYGYSDPVTTAVQGWLKSPGHLANIRGNFENTGIGVVVSNNGTNEIFFTQIFFTPKTTSATTPKTTPVTTPVTPISSNVSNNTTQVAGSKVDIAALEQAIFKQINDYRVSQGFKKLTRNSAIDNRARIHSQDMAQGKVPFGHTGFSERIKAVGIPYSSAGENVAYNYGYNDPVTTAVQGWLKSPGHLANIRGNFEKTGIGVASNSRGEIYFTQIFFR